MKGYNDFFDRTADFSFFQIFVIDDIEIDGKIYKDKIQKNNNSILTPDNWEQHKHTFFKQRMENYKSSYKQDEKIKLELEDLEKLTINETDYKILKERYKDYLINIKTNPPLTKNFKDWIVFKPDWKEISWQYNTGKRYQNKQDLIAVFWNSYIDLQQKLEAYYSKFEKIPHDYFKELIFEFRQNFPKNGRIEDINYYDDLIEQLTEKYSQPQPVQETTPTKESEAEYTKAIKKLKTIWLAEPKISVEDFIQKGVDKGLWNENLKIITSRGSLYGTGKVMLSSIFIAFKDWAISINTDYNEVGKVFCEVFNVDIKETTKEPYKAFSSGNQKIINEIKRTFGVKNS